MSLKETKIFVYNQNGEKIGEEKLPSYIFNIEINPDLLHQAVVTQMANSRSPIAHTKTRGEVRGGGRKPWRQKGTGRARHGSIRSPIWRGGGVTFGPRKEKVFAKKLNKKMKRKALFMALSSKVKDNELILLDDLKLEKPKTKIMENIIKNIKTKILNEDVSKKIKRKKCEFLIALPKKDINVIKATENIPYIDTIPADSLNVLDILKYKYLLMPKQAIGVIEKVYCKNDKK